MNSILKLLLSRITGQALREIAIYIIERLDLEDVGFAIVAAIRRKLSPQAVAVVKFFVELYKSHEELDGAEKKIVVTDRLRTPGAVSAIADSSVVRELMAAKDSVISQAIEAEVEALKINAYGPAQ